MTVGNKSFSDPNKFYNSITIEVFNMRKSTETGNIVLHISPILIGTYTVLVPGLVFQKWKRFTQGNGCNRFYK